MTVETKKTKYTNSGISTDLCRLRTVADDHSRGAVIRKAGRAGEGRIVDWTVKTYDDPSLNEEIVVVAWKGWGENPGSRYSGLHAYYPAETEVLVLDHVDNKGRKNFRTLTSWQTRPPKN